ncbi:MAG TPA: hypothetical protein V6D03_14780 [Candidatus Caenarcaniphilales bacterium]
MAKSNQENDKEKFFYPTSRYYGKFTPENLAFNANLQEFAQRVSFLCSLETGGKLAPGEAYQEIKTLWNKLEQSKLSLLDQPPTPPTELPEN